MILIKKTCLFINTINANAEKLKGTNSDYTETSMLVKNNNLRIMFRMKKCVAIQAYHTKVKLLYEQKHVSAHHSWRQER